MAGETIREIYLFVVTLLNGIKRSNPIGSFQEKENYFIYFCFRGLRLCPCNDLASYNKLIIF